jgi:hypothetical protein
MEDGRGSLSVIGMGTLGGLLVMGMGLGNHMHRLDEVDHALLQMHLRPSVLMQTPRHALLLWICL